MKKQKSFNNHRTNGFALNLPNGIRISTIFGYGNYCENYNWGEDVPTLERYNKLIPEGSNDAEIMVYCPDEKWLDRFNKKYGSGDTVIENVTIEKWFEILKKCWDWKPKKSNPNKS